MLAAVNFLLELESEMFLMNIPGKWRRPLFLDLTCETFFSSTEIMTLFMRYLKRQSLSYLVYCLIYLGTKKLQLGMYVCEGGKDIYEARWREGTRHI